IQQAALFPGRVVRGANLPTDPVGMPGPITFLDSSMVNIDYSIVEAYDIQADYLLKTGRGDFEFYAIATRATRFERKITVNSSVDEYVGFLDGPMDWRGNIGLTWHAGPWTLGWNMQYYNDYFVYNAADSQSPGQVAYLTMVQGSPKIPSQH